MFDLSFQRNLICRLIDEKKKNVLESYYEIVLLASEKKKNYLLSPNHLKK